MVDDSSKPALQTQLLPFRLLSKKELAGLLGITVRTVDRLILLKKIPIVRMPTGVGTGTRVKFDTRDIEKWIREASIEADHEAGDIKEAVRRLLYR